jgi:DNA (cytosine-5)-methyltransferase 1
VAQPQDPAPIAFSCKDYAADAGPVSPPLRAMNNADSHASGGGQVAVAFTQNSRSEVRLIAGDGSVTGAIMADHGAQQQTYVAAPEPSADLVVRRLMPSECEVLQGFEPGYTRIPVRHYARRTIGKNRPADMWERDPAGGWWLMAADGPRYKALGNSMAVPVMSFIGQRIDAALARSGS